LALAPIGAYLAVTGEFNLIPLLISFAVLFWVSGFDIIYSLQDIDFDRSHNLRSFPVLLGQKGALILSSIFHLLTAGFIFFAGYYGGFGSWYWIGCAIFSALLVYQHTLVKVDDLSNINLAFFTTNGIGSVVFAIFVILDLAL
ncbi:MAG: UbiA family prenyltransferase, partial [Flavobacteriales bacterium]|nr:UbiA family prenyltransferase [Flavobacteriales bacterium]